MHYAKNIQGACAMGDGGSLLDVLMLSLPLAVIGGVLLVLDGVKKEFETRAFFGVMCVVWAGLMVGHRLHRGSYDGNAENQDSAMTEPAADAAAPAIASFSNSYLLLKLGDQTVSGDESMSLADTNARLEVICYEDISVGISAKQALPQTLKVTIESPDLEPGTRIAESTYDDENEGGFRRIFKMNTRCDLMDNATIVVEGLQSEPAQVGTSAGNKITVQLSKK
jgi:hypothetical protein